MNLKQIFCKHIFKLVDEEKLGTFIVYFFRSPIRKEVEWLYTSECVKCKKTTFWTSRVEYNLTLEEHDKYDRN